MHTQSLGADPKVEGPAAEETIRVEGPGGAGGSHRETRKGRCVVVGTLERGDGGVDVTLVEVSGVSCAGRLRRLPTARQTISELDLARNPLPEPSCPVGGSSHHPSPADAS